MRIQTKFDNAYRTAYWAKDSLDSKPGFFCEKLAKEDYKRFLEEKIKNPTLATIALKKVETKEKIDYPVNYKNYKIQLEKDPEIQLLIKKINEIESTQPKYLQRLNNFITSDRKFLDYITPDFSILKKITAKIKKYIQSLSSCKMQINSDFKNKI